MSLSAPSRRIAPRCLFQTSAAVPIQLRTHQNRTFSHSRPRSAQKDGAEDDKPKQANPVLEEYLRKHPTAPSDPRGRQMEGDLAPSSIFEDDRRAQEQAQREHESDQGNEAKKGSIQRDPRNSQRKLDPDPESRELWQREKVIEMVRRGGRLDKVQFLKRTEREHLVKSHNMKTSVKKLGALARQIAGKNIDDAITQMRFSKKKVAQDVMKQLEFARDEAVVMRGMGLGSVQTPDTEARTLNETSALLPGKETPGAAKYKNDEPVEIQLKDGKRHLVADRSKIYIDQVWVGRGPYGKLPDYRARGRLYIMRTPWTHINLLLKEETTRVREYEEREVKRRRQRLENLWVPLPDRPIQTKSQWYCW